MKKIIYATLSLVLTYSGIAHSEMDDQKVDLNSSGMPVAIKSFSESRIIRFKWDHFNHYKRRIHFSECLQTPCEWSDLPANTGELVGVRLDARTMEALNQIYHGGDEFRPEKTVEQFLRAHPIERYTYQINVNLTQRFGAGFSAAVYAYLLANDQRNMLFAQKFRSELSAFKFEDLDLLKRRLRNVEVLVSNGYLQGSSFVSSTSKHVSIEAGLEDLKSIVSVIMLPTRTGDVVADNAQIIYENLKAELAKGKDVICLGISKGGFELQAALSMLNQESFFTEHTKGRGRVLGVLLASSVTVGSPIADWALSDPLYWLSSLMIKDYAGSHHEHITNVRNGLRTLSKQYLESFYPEVARNLPNRLLYINLIGMTDEFGFVGNSSIRSLQESILAGPFFPAHGANDGLLEYPLIGASHEVSPYSYQIPFLNSGHELMDGTVYGNDLKDKPTRIAVLSALVASILDFKSR